MPKAMVLSLILRLAAGSSGVLRKVVGIQELKAGKSVQAEIRIKKKQAGREHDSFWKGNSTQRGGFWVTSKDDPCSGVVRSYDLAVCVMTSNMVP